MESLNSSERKYTTVIIGGGPETLIFLLEILKQSKIHDLLNKDGCVILEKSSAFGPGFMENFIARSTKTSALTILKLLLRHPEATENNKQLMELIQNGKVENSLSLIVATIKNIKEYPKFYELCAPMFRELLETTVFGRLLQDNLKKTSLFEAGYFLKLLGNSYLWHLKVVKNAKIFHPKKEIVNLRLLNDGTILVTARIVTDETTEGKQKLSLHPSQNSYEIFEDYKTKRVILTTAGAPRVGSPQNVIPLDKLIDADSFLQESGYERVCSNLKKVQKKKIVILGANPIAFACVKLLLNGSDVVDCYEETTNRNGNFLTKRHKAYQKEEPKIDESLLKGDLSSIGRRSPTLSTTSKKAEDNIVQKAKCHGNHTHDHHHKPQEHASPKKDAKEEAKYQEFLKFGTYGSIKGNENNLPKKSLMFFEEENIIIAYKTEPKLRFSSAQEAKHLNYKYHPQEVDVKGGINTIDGLDEEATALYNDIRSQVEKRVKMHQFNQISDLKIEFEEAQIIIDCQGYEPQMVPIRDVNGELLKIRKGPNGGYMVDSRGRLISEKGVIKGVYTLGLNFEQEKGEKAKVLEAYNKFARYDNFESLLNILYKNETLKYFLQDIKNIDNDTEEHFEDPSKASSNLLSPGKESNKEFDLESLSSASYENEQQKMYSTFGMFEKFDKKSSQKHSKTHR